MSWLLDKLIYSQVLKKRPILECLRKWEEMGLDSAS